MFQCQPGAIKGQHTVGEHPAPEHLRFNASLVRLKATPAAKTAQVSTRFQCQPGAIKGALVSYDRLIDETVSMPAWCD